MQKHEHRHPRCVSALNMRVFWRANSTAELGKAWPVATAMYAMNAAKRSCTACVLVDDIYFKNVAAYSWHLVADTC